MAKPNISDARCVLIVGATAGIGRDLALAIHDLPSKPTVLVNGRRKERLDELSSEKERMVALPFDMTAGRAAIQQFVKETIAQYPDLDAVMFSAGIQHIFDFHKPEKIDLDLLESELNTNYTSIVNMTVLLLPHFLKLSNAGRHSFIMPVTSNLGLAPAYAPQVPNYVSTKAAMHSFALSLDSQLSDTNVHVMEVIPPLTESELHDHQGSRETLSKFWMPLSEFTPQTMEGLLRGDLQVLPGISRNTWEKYEKQKLEDIAARRKG